jgi:D-lactate dehydrogenase
LAHALFVVEFSVVLCLNFLQYDIRSLTDALKDSNFEDSFELTYIDAHLEPTTALLAENHEAICIFVNDMCDADILRQLHACQVVGTLLRLTSDLQVIFL